MATKARCPVGLNGQKWWGQKCTGNGNKLEFVSDLITFWIKKTHLYNSAMYGVFHVLSRILSKLPTAPGHLKGSSAISGSDDKWRDAPRRMASKTFSPAQLKSPGSWKSSSSCSFNPFEKYCSNWIISPRANIINLWNHNLVIHLREKTHGRKEMAMIQVGQLLWYLTWYHMHQYDYDTIHCSTCSALSHPACSTSLRLWLNPNEGKLWSGHPLVAARRDTCVTTIAKHGSSTRGNTLRRCSCGQRSVFD